MTTTLIIGASRGLGREFVRQELSRERRVIATARSESDCADLRKQGAESVLVDVLDADALQALGDTLDLDDLGLVLHVAGIFGSTNGARLQPDRATFADVMATNVWGAMQSLVAFGPHAERGGAPFVFISSDMASIGEAESTHGWVYRSSKAALNMAVHSARGDYPDAILLALSPGWVRTDMGGEEAPLSVEESVRGMLSVIDSLKPEDSGTFRDYEGRQVPW